MVARDANFIDDPTSIKGMIPVPICPYTDDGELDIEGLKENIRFLRDFAEDGEKEMMILTNGSGTECYANTIPEQKEVIQATIEESGDVPVIAGASRAGTRETVQLAKFAESAGADMTMVTVPYYHKPTTEGVYKHYKTIADEVDIGIMVYNNPDVTGSWLKPQVLKRLSKIENVVATKENNTVAPNSYTEARTIEPENMALLCGMGHSTYVSKVAMGGRFNGFVSTIGNFAPALDYDLYEAVQNGNFEQAYEIMETQDHFWGIVEEVMESRESSSLQIPGWGANYMYQSVTKRAMELVGLNGGPVRLPMTDITDEETEIVREGLEQMGVL